MLQGLNYIPTTTRNITATKHICDSNRENNLFEKTDCTEYYVKVRDILMKFTAKPKPMISNITKEESKALNNLRKDESHMVLIADEVLPWLI